MNIIQQLKAARLKQGLKSGAIAEKLGWSENKMSLVENEHRSIKLSDLQKWAELLGYNVCLQPTLTPEQI